MREIAANALIGQAMLFFFMTAFAIVIGVLFLGRDAKKKYDNYARLPLEDDLESKNKE